jgi:hypothetical protein
MTGAPEAVTRAVAAEERLAKVISAWVAAKGTVTALPAVRAATRECEMTMVAAAGGVLILHPLHFRSAQRRVV